MTLEEEFFKMLVDVGRLMIFIVGFGVSWLLWNLLMAAFWGDEDEGTSRKRRPRSERRKKSDDDQGPTLPRR